MKGREAFYFGTVIIGIGLLFLEINLYRRTLIPISIPLTVTLALTIVTFFIIKSDYNKTYGKSGFFYAVIQSLTSFGFIGCFSFMALNYYLADKDIQTQTFAIKSKHTIGTKNPQPAIEIDYNDVNKQFVFYTGQQEEVNRSDSILLTVQRGLFGFDVFRDIRLQKPQAANTGF